MKKKKISVLSIILLLSVGFAVIATTLGIRATFSFGNDDWNVYFENLQLKDTSLSTTPTYSLTDSTISLNANFTTPGDYTIFTIDAINDGSVVANLDELEITGISSELEDYLEVSLTYFNNTPVEVNDKLYPDSSRKINIYIGYKYDVDNFIPISATDISLSIQYTKAKRSNVVVTDISYEGEEYIYNVVNTGIYKLEVWGASGGNTFGEGSYEGGYGGYSKGEIQLTAGDKLHV